MKKFNKATRKCSYLVMHEQLEYHKVAVVRSMSLCESLEQPESSLAYKISSLNKELYDKNFKINSKANNILWKQNVPLCGHRDDSTSITVNKGNFLALLHLMVLKNHLEQGKRNAKCTSKTTQIYQLLLILFKDYNKIFTTFNQCFFHYS